ncbi:MAG: DNA polymerase III subunit delta' [Candidatus Omnitrophica bacterium]|nr:DNA polymerase III subunit delta' [Candidatus Omnitrophota bacterium]MDD5725548.1 DNA polymerase III subunit delta' [Candidatus Omnitrophota bacterium]
MRFNDCLGHEKILGLVLPELEKNRFLGSYIFSGPEGIGKKMAALAIAQYLNCEGEGERPCQSCGGCLKLQNGQHPDLHIIQNGEAQVKIEDIREILRQAGFRPYEGRVKVFIVDNAHKLNPEAANSLLKILEEPPKDALFILITHKPQSIIKTVLSRCRMIKFSPLPRGRLEDILVKDYFLDRSAAHFLAFYSEGRLGLALKLKDTALLREKNRIIESLALSSKPLDREIMGQNKEQLQSSLNILASWFRDIYILKCGAGCGETVNSDRQEDLVKLAGRFSFRQLDEIICLLSESSRYLEKNINSKLILHNLQLGVSAWKG